MPQALAFRAQNQRERLAQHDVAEVFAAFAVQANGLETDVVQLVQRASEVLHGDHGHELERAGGGFCQHAGRFGTVAGGGDDRLHRKRRGRAQDRPDIVRIGDLIEHQHHAFLRQRLDIG